MAHTPGPWRLAGYYTVIEGPVFAPETVTFVDRLSCSENENRDEERRANARLIAAAPELLHELEILIGYAKAKHVPTAREIAMARAVIEKTEEC